MCNCKKYKANNLSDKNTIKLINEAYTTLISQKSQEDFTEADWVYLYMVYNQAYPNSKGTPSQTDLVNVLTAAQGKQTAYK